MARSGYNPVDNTWTTKDGKTSKLEELDDDHLGNITAFLARGAESYLKAEKKRRRLEDVWDDIYEVVVDEGEHTPEYDTAFEWLRNEYQPYIAICEEMKRRGCEE